MEHFKRFSLSARLDFQSVLADAFRADFRVREVSFEATRSVVEKLLDGTQSPCLVVSCGMMLIHVGMRAGVSEGTAAVDDSDPFPYSCSRLNCTDTACELFHHPAGAPPTAPLVIPSSHQALCCAACHAALYPDPVPTERVFTVLCCISHYHTMCFLQLRRQRSEMRIEIGESTGALFACFKCNAEHAQLLAFSSWCAPLDTTRAIVMLNRKSKRHSELIRKVYRHEECATYPQFVHMEQQRIALLPLPWDKLQSILGYRRIECAVSRGA
jgi:hypothetical protein